MKLLKPVVCYLVIITATLYWASYQGVKLTDAVLNFDAKHYNTISQRGYEGYLQAFFPLFPYLWKTLGIGPIAICVVNGLIYLGALALLQKELRATLKTFMYWLVIPSACFFWLPYSESIFFLSSTLLLIGTNRNDLRLSGIGLFLCTLSRPAFTVLIPALLLTEVFHITTRSLFVKRMTVYMIIATIALALVTIIQWMDTGEWFGFYHAQAGWGNHLRMPTLPLTSWGGAPSVRLDAVALLVGTSASVFLAWNIYKGQGKLLFPKELTLSLLYLGGISSFVLMMRGGELFSLNRFVFATPYFLVALHYLDPINIQRSRITLLGLAFLIFFLFFGSYVHIQTFIAYIIITVYLITVLLTFSQTSKPAIARYFILSLTLGLQVYYFLRFLNGGWVA